MTDDLVQFIRDRLDVEEQIARECTSGPWRNAPTARHHATASGRTEEAVFASPRDAGATIVAATGEASDRRNLANAEHIARHSPARVLAEVDAKRQLLDLHSVTTLRQQYSEAELRSTYGPYWEQRVTDLDVPYCEICDFEDGVIQSDGTPCASLRLLALPFADHPDYREEWRP